MKKISIVFLLVLALMLSLLSGCSPFVRPQLGITLDFNKSQDVNLYHIAAQGMLQEESGEKPIVCMFGVPHWMYICYQSVLDVQENDIQNIYEGYCSNRGKNKMIFYIAQHGNEIVNDKEEVYEFVRIDD